MAATELRDPDRDIQEAVPDSGDADQITPEEYYQYLERQGVGQLFDPKLHVSVPLLKLRFPEMSDKLIRNLVEKEVQAGRLEFIGSLYDPTRERKVKAYKAVRE